MRTNNRNIIISGLFLKSCLLSVGLNVGFAQSSTHILADTLLLHQAYYKAAEIYKLNLNTSDSAVKCHCLRKLAYSYTRLNEVKAAENTYRTLFSDCKTGTEDLRELAKILQRLGEYEKAKRLYASCYAADTSDKFAYGSILFCESVNKSFDKITEVYLENLAEINSPFDDVLDDALNDTLVFMSSRKSKGQDRRSIYNNQYGYCRFKWDSWKRTVERMNTPSSQGFIANDIETNDMYTSKVIPVANGNRDSRTVILRQRSGEMGVEEQLFTFDDGTSMYGHPHISASGTMFFFVSDMPGGYGGTDIYLCKKSGNKWSAPANLGKGINTTGNELFPFYLGEGLFVFSSDGHPGYGGYDLYTSIIQNNNWKYAVNLGSPVNSRSNDIALRLDRIKKTFYLSSDRNKGKGALDIYKLHNFNSGNVKSVF